MKSRQRLPLGLFAALFMFGSGRAAAAPPAKVDCRAEAGVDCAEASCIEPHALIDENLELAVQAKIDEGHREWASGMALTDAEARSEHLRQAYAALSQARSLLGSLCNPSVLLQLGQLSQLLGQKEQGIRDLAPLRCTVVGDRLAAEEPYCEADGWRGHVAEGRALWQALVVEVSLRPTPVHTMDQEVPSHSGETSEYPWRVLMSGSALLTSRGIAADASVNYMVTDWIGLGAGPRVTPYLVGVGGAVETVVGRELFLGPRLGIAMLWPSPFAEWEGAKLTKLAGASLGLRGGYGKNIAGFVDLSAEWFPSAEQPLAVLASGGVLLRWLQWSEGEGP